MNEELIHRLLSVEPCSNCETLVELVMELVDVQLDEQICSMLHEHVAHCQFCQAHHDVEVHIRRLIRASVNCSAPAGLHARIVAKMETWHIEA